MSVDPTRSQIKAATFIGGMRWPAGAGTLGGNATTPLVRLRIDGEGVHLAPNGRLVRFLARMFLMPSFDFSWSDMRRVVRSSSWFLMTIGHEGIRAGARAAPPCATGCY